MALEIERKFLVRGDAWRAYVTKSTPYRQGYLSTDPERNVRVRTKGEKAVLTIKGKPKDGTLTRLELEYDIPLADAAQLLALCHQPLIEKTRHRLVHGGKEWVIDDFEGDNAGLVLAEIELESEDERFEVPDWAGDEVTDDPRYLNANLVSAPYGSWSADSAD